MRICSGVRPPLTLPPLVYSSFYWRAATPNACTTTRGRDGLAPTLYPWIHSVLSGIRGFVSFWGDVYTVRKWKRNLRTEIQKCVPANTHTDALQKYLHRQVHKTIWRNKMFFANDARFPFTTPAHLYWDRLPRVFGRAECPFQHTPYASLPWFCILP